MNRPLRRARRAEPTFEEFAADAGMPVADLMREVAEFRVALEADMTVAAAAAELGEAEIASSIVGAELQHLADFENRAMRALTPRSPAPVVSHRHVRRTRLAFAAALALITALGGAISFSDRSSPSTPSTSNLALAAAMRYADFATLASGDVSAQQMIAAATRLHATLADLVRQDPGSADQVASILRSEQQQLLRWLPAGTTIVLADAKALVARMRAGAPANAAAVLSQVRIASPPPQSQERTHSNATASPKPTTSPSPKPAPSPTSSPKPQPAPTPTQQPSSSPSPTPPVLPGGPKNPLP